MFLLQQLYIFSQKYTKLKHKHTALRNENCNTQLCLRTSMNHTHVFFHGLRIRKAFETDRALERLLAGVNPLMLLQVSDLTKPLVTLGALIRLLSSVNALMDCQILGLVETLPTLKALMSTVFHIRALVASALLENYLDKLQE